MSSVDHVAAAVASTPAEHAHLGCQPIRGVASIPILVRRPVLSDQLGTQVNPVHRLDAGTSGCLVFAEDSETTAALQRAFASGRVRKTYIAVARGNAMPTLGEGLVVERPVRDDKGVLRAARTELMCLGGCDGEEVAGEGEAVTGRLNLGASLVVAEPTTGRFHQIRKHLGGLSHPILGDAKHGDSRVNRWWREERGLRSLALHCASLEIELEEGGEVLQVRCPVREDIADLCGRMPWAAAATFEAVAARMRRTVRAAAGPKPARPGSA